MKTIVLSNREAALVLKGLELLKAKILSNPNQVRIVILKKQLAEIHEIKQIIEC